MTKVFLFLKSFSQPRPITKRRLQGTQQGTPLHISVQLLICRDLNSKKIFLKNKFCPQSCLILSGTAPADLAKPSHRTTCFVPKAICAESSKLPGARGQGAGPAILPLRLGGAGRGGVQGCECAPVCECVKVSVTVYAWPEGVVGGAGAGGRRKGA